MLPLVAVTLRLQREHTAERPPTLADVWSALPERTRCLLSGGGGWVHDRVRRLVVECALEGWPSDAIAEEIRRRELVEFPYPDDPRKPRAVLVQPWLDVLTGDRACPHADHALGPGNETTLRVALERPTECTPDDYYLW